ncbi:uncharacterized protein RCO7_11229 [Rhynchosporium graminicola]|uniref:Uncharacterized protein n=1 Tax=Rhynchosporium graminicola TaxID=2792576 RepID=A0A1E1LB68_9HELO|nr:uncharacterized protein RCO7_11229 [Rhynchosporium commune]
MQQHTIQNAFKNAGIWPLSYKAGLKRIRSFGKQKATNLTLRKPELPLLLSTPTERVHKVTTIIESFIGRDPTQFSDQSKEIFQDSMEGAVIQLHKAYITSADNAILQQKLQNSAKRIKTSRRSIKGNGGSPGTISDLRLQIQAKAEADRKEGFKRASRILSNTIGRYKATLKQAGVLARKRNRARKLQLKEIQKKGEIVPSDSELWQVEREPYKQPTPTEVVLSSEEGYPALVVSKKQFELELDRDLDKEVEIFCTLSQALQEEDRYIESSPPIQEFEESSESDQEEDGITAGIDYIEF